MATESICLNPLSFARFTKNPLNQFRKRRKLSSRIRCSQFGVICSKTSDYQDFQSYARPLRLLPAEDVKVCSTDSSFTVSESRSRYKLKLQTSNLFGSGISDMNARVLICLIDEKGDSVLQTIPANLSSNESLVSENDESFKFQRGSVDEFTFEGPELGKIRAFWIGLESGQWRVGGVSLWVVNPRGQGPILGETDVETYCYRYDFEVDDILLGESSDLSMSYARPLRLLPAEKVKVCSSNSSFTVSESRPRYKVKLQTSNLFGSGISDMNARVLICLIDEKGDSILQTIPANLSCNESLDPEVTENDESFKFQRGSVDEFTFEGPELGKIRAFWISLESGQWRVGGVSLWVVNPPGQGPILGEAGVESYCYRYDFEVDDILLGESSDLSMVELRPTRITQLTDSDQISSSSAPNLDRTFVTNEQSMEEYANLKLSLLLYDAILILLGSFVVSFSLGENSAIAFFFGGTLGFLYLLLLQRSVDELQAPGSSSSENRNQIFSGRLKIPVLSLALAIGLLVLAVRAYNGVDSTAFAVTPKEIVVGTLGFLVCKVAVVLAAFKPLKDGS